MLENRPLPMRASFHQISYIETKIGTQSNARSIGRGHAAKSERNLKKPSCMIAWDSRRILTVVAGGFLTRLSEKNAFKRREGHWLTRIII